MTMERYSYEYALILENSLKNTDQTSSPAEQIGDFLRDYLNFETSPANFKAGHFLVPSKLHKICPFSYNKVRLLRGKVRNQQRKVTVIKMFESFKQNPNIGGRTPVKIRFNYQTICREPESDYHTTMNSQVKVFWKTVQCVVHSVSVDSLKAEDDIKEIAPQQETGTQPMPTSIK